MAELIRNTARLLMANPGDPALHRALFDAIYGCIKDDVARYAKRLLPWYQAAELEDILHDTLCIVFAKAVKLCEQEKLDIDRSPSTIAAYFRKIARNALLDQANRTRNEGRKLPLQLLVDVPEAKTSAIDPELKELAINAVSRLPESDREVVYLRIFEKLSYDEIANKISISANTARVRYHRAIKRLRSGFAK